MQLPPSKLPDVGTTIFTVMSALAQEAGAINLSQGFPNFDCSPRLQDLVYRYMREGKNQYAPMAGLPVLRERLAEKIDRLYGVGVDPDDEITVTAGATQALFCAIAAFVRTGDEVILLEPAYDSYRPSIEVNGGKAVPYELSAPDYRVDWAALERLVSPRTRMLIVNTPHNPTGTILQAEDLRQLEEIALRHDLIVLSDEVYEHLIYDGQPHESVLRYPELFARSLAVYSFGKTFHNTGWKVGYCVAPAPLMAEFRKVHQFNVFSVNTPVQYALAEFLADPEEYLSLGRFYQAKRDFFLEAMKGSPLRPLPCRGTYFQLFDYRAVSDLPDTGFAKWLTVEAKVAAIPVSVFYSSGRDERVIRLCFAKTEEVLEQAGRILKRVER
ncbi:MAG: pyridoxal phosphate-dependent aminotransferase [Saprospiraceae bacterium]|nr:pyridoxal phosphate-dependent aminotransferase [Saprospiraceae bacterium]MCB0622373.1 pyridoxal phosphate-dependent aminotransferase [Saprospiraceae bacterium]MCB0677857.1 pyridoxal phosphate-dependent aminotransferase [Saprospiraceae bacterium]MCB0680651.1 pyridoxal phosphate-dependent aminotransferase [Saprospiraceae bacterium]